MLTFLTLIPLFTLPVAKAAPQATSSGNCVGTIASLSDVSAAVLCTTVNINPFTVPDGNTFSLDLLQGTTVNVLGNIQFGSASWRGPLFEIKGEDITFNGNSYTWDGNGPSLWDGFGTNGGTTKPTPMMRIEMSGTLSNIHVVNAPAQSFSVDNDGQLVIDGVIIDNSQGDSPNSNSNGLPAGHNTDGFDVSGSNLVIRNSVVMNQDDCLAINKGENIVFENNHCDGGHGISIGSITSNVVVENVVIQGNTVVNSMQAFRIKTDKDAINSSVSNITYSDNTATNCTSYGVLITQSYPSSVGDPGDGVVISDVNFDLGTTYIDVASDATTVAVNCGLYSCTGVWDWSYLQTSGSSISFARNIPDIIGYTLS